MTIKLRKTPDTVADRILRALGKERAYLVPAGLEKPVGPSGYAVTSKESFWRALFRSKGAPLPADRISSRQIDDLLGSRD